MGHKFSASEALSYGLVSEVLWPDKFQESLLPKVALLASQSAQVRLYLLNLDSFRGHFLESNFFSLLKLFIWLFFPQLASQSAQVRFLNSLINYLCEIN